MREIEKEREMELIKRGGRWAKRISWQSEQSALQREGMLISTGSWREFLEKLKIS